MIMNFGTWFWLLVKTKGWTKRILLHMHVIIHFLLFLSPQYCLSHCDGKYKDLKNVASILTYTMWQFSIWFQLTSHMAYDILRLSQKRSRKSDILEHVYQARCSKYISNIYSYISVKETSVVRVHCLTIY